jgi:hypothetical protein
MQWFKTTTLLIAAAAFGGLTALATGDTPDPVFWTFGKPHTNSDAWGHDHIIRAVMHGTKDDDGPLDPEYVADRIDDMINLEGAYWNHHPDDAYEAGEICIILSGLGTGNGPPDADKAMCPALFRHWCDALHHHTTADPDLACETDTVWQDPCTFWWLTPWMTHGVENDANGGCDWEDYGTGDWMEEFIARYRFYQVNPLRPHTNPDPTRFHFEAECPWGVTNHFLDAFDHLDDQNETRWDSEYIYGFDDKTMEDLWDEADSQGWGNVTGWDTDGNWDDADNGPWLNWWTSTYRRAMEGAMEAACYDQVHQTWGSDLPCSNYVTSCRIGSDYNYIPLGPAGALDWSDVHWEGLGDLQAPVLYGAHTNHCGGCDPNTSPHWEATRNIYRHNIDACIQTLLDLDPPGHPEEITPWIMNIGQENKGLTMSKPRMRETLTMLRSRKLKEFIIWNGGGPGEDDWDDLADVIDQVWMYDFDTCSLITGTQSSPEPCSNMEYARDGGDYSVNAADVGNTYKAVVQVEFTTSENSPSDQLLALFEAKMGISMNPPTVNVTAKVYNYHTFNWDGLTMGSPDNELGGGDTKLFIAKTGMILPTDVYVANGRSKIRMIFESEQETSFSVHIDSAVLAEKDPTP